MKREMKQILFVPKVPLNGIRNFQLLLLLPLLQPKLCENPQNSGSGVPEVRLPGSSPPSYSYPQTLSSYTDHMWETTESPPRLSSLNPIPPAVVDCSSCLLLLEDFQACSALGAGPSHLTTDSPFDLTGRWGRKYTFLVCNFSRLLQYRFVSKFRFILYVICYYFEKIELLVPLR